MGGAAGTEGARDEAFGERTEGARGLPIEGECGRLLSTLREMGVPLVRRRYDRGGMIYDGDEAGRAL